jgi:hypothetical protein
MDLLKHPSGRLVSLIQEFKVNFNNAWSFSTEGSSDWRFEHLSKFNLSNAWSFLIEGSSDWRFEHLSKFNLSYAWSFPIEGGSDSKDMDNYPNSISSMHGVCQWHEVDFVVP